MTAKLLILLASILWLLMCLRFWMMIDPKNKGQRHIIAIAAGIGAGLIYFLGTMVWSLVSAPAPEKTPNRGPEQPQEIRISPPSDLHAIKVLESIYSSNLEVFGKVVDEQGSPVADATISFSLNDKYFEEGTKGITQSDQDGHFRIQGVGASIYLRASKKGYYMITNKSSTSIRSERQTSDDNPVILTLRKAGQPQSLTFNRIKGQRLTVDGVPAEIHLGKQSEFVKTGEGHLRIEVLVSERRGQYERFAWRCKVSVPGGGIADREDDLAFEAPEDGYVESMEFSMTADPPPGQHWVNAIVKGLFLHLPDNTYARGDLFINIDNEDAHASLASYWNQSGSRNLEADTDQFGSPQ